MVVCNVDWESMEAAGLSEGQQLIRDAFDEYGVRDYVILVIDIAVVAFLVKMHLPVRRPVNSYSKIQSRR